MNHQDHVNLLRPGIEGPGGTWADFGSGTGAFTLALAELIQPSGSIISVDKDRHSLRQQEASMRSRFPSVSVTYLQEDYSRRLSLPNLDGIVAANTLHFHVERGNILKLFFDYLKPSGRLILVEYNVDKGNVWVPYPFSYPVWEKMAHKAGFSSTRLLTTRGSHFLNEIYSAVSYK